jgi:predicted histidine transporter YuiF (NhaC family)
MVQALTTSYKENRLDEQIKWHSKKARQDKLRFRLYQIITLIVSAIIPIINVANIGELQTRIISSIIGALIVVVTGLTQLEKYQESWYYIEPAQSC